MNVGRSNYSVVQWNQYFCVAGGISGAIRTTLVELYDPTEDEWTQLAPMNRCRAGFAMLKWNESLYAIGGDDNIERFDSWKNRWTKVRAQTEK